MSTFQLVGRPPATADYRSRSRYRDAGLLIAVSGLMAVAVATVANLVVGDNPIASRQDTLAWSSGVNFAGFEVIMVAIAVTLGGIIVRLWMRVESIKTALPRLKGDATAEEPQYGRERTAFGEADVTPLAPRPALIHRVAEAMWTPLALMAPMVVATGLVLSIVQAAKMPGSEAFRDLGALASGTEVLGLALMLGAISFILGTVLSSLRKGGGEVQESVGVAVKSLRVPATAWAFVGLMAAGVMAAVGQFVVAIVTTTLDSAASYAAWVGPLGIFSLGLLLSGIVLALYTIGTALGFQFSRIRQIIANGR
jgi:hypothetical protein